MGIRQLEVDVYSIVDKRASRIKEYSSTCYGAQILFVLGFESSLLATDLMGMMLRVAPSC